MKKTIRKLKECKELVSRVSKAVRRAQISLYSAQAAYFVIFSAIPFLMLFVAIFDLFVPELNVKIADIAVKYYPSSDELITVQTVKRFIDAGVATVPASLLVIFWSASRGVRAIGEGISGIYGSAFGKKNLLWRYVYSFLYTLIFIASTLVTLLLLVFGKYIGIFLTKIFPGDTKFFETLFGWRVLITAAVLVSFFVLFYKLLGSKGMPWRKHLPGALFSGIGWIGYSLLFSLYLRYFSNWQSIYGSLSVLMILMLWMYSCMYIMMLGALINMYWMKHPKIV